ncbi:hypothetical protein E2C01_032004 [Portunus trituberculatus]|uniref:Uncharacterized protein n=1 Tax=Portunus trituberculatus TaxID=210409 RepID=A0A5B7EZ66_PORTR|nr:hypothetical protein [Portunus trituberculatus]
MSCNARSWMPQCLAAVVTTQTIHLHHIITPAVQPSAHARLQETQNTHTPTLHDIPQERAPHTTTEARGFRDESDNSPISYCSRRRVSNIKSVPALSSTHSSTTDATSQNSHRYSYHLHISFQTH